MQQIKEILCLHHSHLDVGYTHPQNLLMEWQCEYIEQAIDLCIKTKDYPEEAQFRWTCEATYPVTKWLKTAQPERVAQFCAFIKEGRISITALPMHTTPGVTAAELACALHSLDELRALTGSKINTAINHDVNGQPWTMASLLLDSGVDFYMTGINIHMGGIPMKRPCVFNWKTQDGRTLPSFVGEHYSLFSQFLFTDENDTAKTHQGVVDYVSRISETVKWPYDFLILTATNPPLFDNNCPDHNLPDLIARYNAEGHEYKIRFATPEILWARICSANLALPEHGGDWTDYWNFGCASTAREVKISRHTKQKLQTTDFLESAANWTTPHLDSVKAEAWHNVLLFDEHTWGAAESITQYDQDETYAQENHKKDYAYLAADQSAFALSRHLEHAGANEPQFDRAEGVVLINPNGFDALHEVAVSPYALQDGRSLSSLRSKSHLPYAYNQKETVKLGWAAVPPYSKVFVPFASLQKAQNTFTVTDEGIETPFYRVLLDGKNKTILQITDKRTNRDMLDENAAWKFFDIIQERIDGEKAELTRATFFPRDVDLGNKSISQWQHNWPALHTGITEISCFDVTQDNGCISLHYHVNAFDLQNVVQTVTFSSVHARILLDVAFTKPADTQPASIFFAFPLQTKNAWECMFDSAESFVRLDSEQLGTACRDWLTVDKAISIYDTTGGVTLACPDAPMVQVGSFGFGREQRNIARSQNPLLLAWPMNNYWETNFAYSQQGKFNFHYELTAFAQYSNAAMYEAGMNAFVPCAQEVVSHCAMPETYFSCTNPVAYPIFMRRSADNALLVALKNFSAEAQDCTVTMHAAKLASVGYSSIQGALISEIICDNNQFTASLRPNALVFVAVRLNNQ